VNAPLELLFRSCILVLFVLATCAAQSPTLLFGDVRLFYQKPGETKFRDDSGVLALDGSQKAMILMKDNRPLFVMRYENITGMTFEEKRSRTLTLRFGGSSGPAGSARMELPGKWRDILAAIRAQSGQQIEMIAKK